MVPSDRWTKSGHDDSKGQLTLDREYRVSKPNCLLILIDAMYRFHHVGGFFYARLYDSDSQFTEGLNVFCSVIVSPVVASPDPSISLISSY